MAIARPTAGLQIVLQIRAFKAFGIFIEDFIPFTPVATTSCDHKEW
jgi:hypothetical protein